MSHSQPQPTVLGKRKKTLKQLESNTDVSAGPSTNGTDGSTLRLLSLPRLGPIESTSEPSPNMVAGNADTIQNQIATQINIEPSRNAFARPDDRAGLESHAGSSDNSVPAVSRSSGPSASSERPQPRSLDLADEPSSQIPPDNPRLSNATTSPLPPLGNATHVFPPEEGRFSFEPDTESTVANNNAVGQATADSPSTDPPQPPPTPALHAQPFIPSIRAALYPCPTPILPPTNPSPRPQIQNREHIPTDLPIREEPPAPTTFARIQRSLTRAFQRRAPPANNAAAVELAAFHSSDCVPRLARDGEAAEMRRRAEEGGDLEQAGVEREMGRGVMAERRRQRAFRIWMPVCVVLGAGVFAAIYVGATRGT